MDKQIIKTTEPLSETCASLMQSDITLELILDTITDFAIIIMTAEGEILSWNSGVERIFGYQESEFVGQPFKIIFTPEDRVEGIPEREISAAIGSGKAVDERWHLKKNGDRFFAIGTVRPITENGKTCGLIKVIQDLTTKQLEKEELTRAKKEAESANQIREYFVSIASHELRSPLMTILTAVEVLEADVTTEERLQFVEMIKRSALVQARMVDDLLDATKIGHDKLSLRIGRVEAHDEIESIVKDIGQEAAAKKVQIVVHTDAKEQRLCADPIRFRQVVRNLLANAIKFSADGASVTISTRDDIGGSIRIEVEDKGIGMTEETIKRIFIPFDQGTPDTKRRFGGLGLGLTIAKALVEQHKGTIRVESAGLGFGSKFILQWPTDTKSANRGPDPHR